MTKHSCTKHARRDLIKGNSISLPFADRKIETITLFPRFAESSMPRNSSQDRRTHRPEVPKTPRPPSTSSFRVRDASGDSLHDTRYSFRFLRPRRQIVGDGGTNQRCQSGYVDFVIFMEVDRSRHVGVQASVEQPLWVMQRRTLEEIELHLVFERVGGWNSKGSMNDCN